MSYFDQYLESRVLSASPVELVRIIYRGALDATAAARHHFGTGDIAERTRALNRAAALVTELVTTLEPGPDPQLELNLRRLYDFVLHQIAQAAIDQSSVPLDPADAILRSLLEAWETVEATPAVDSFVDLPDAATQHTSAISVTA